jgi:hypothetical protein
VTGGNKLFPDSTGEAGRDDQMSANSASFCCIYEKSNYSSGRTFSDKNAATGRGYKKTMILEPF